MAMHIRRMIRRDLPTVLSIEQQNFDASWTEGDFIEALQTRGVVGMVVEDKKCVVGFVVYSCEKACLCIWNCAVELSSQRCGIGTIMFDKLKRSLGRKRDELIFRIAERNLGGQLFLRSQGFVAMDIARGFYGDGQDCYRMVFRVGQESFANEE